MSPDATAPTVEVVALPDALAIPGLRYRRYRGAADHPDMVRILNAEAEADDDPEHTTLEGLASEYANLTNSDPYQDALVAEVDDRMVGFARVEWRDQNDGSRRYDTMGHVDPPWRRQGIGRALLHWCLERLRLIGAGHGSVGERWFGAWAGDADRAGLDLLGETGFRPIRRFHLMVRPTLDDIVVPPLPDGLEVRPVRDEDLRAIFLADSEAFLDHFGGVDPSDASFRRWVEHPTFDPSLFVVAWDGDDVAGAVLGLIDADENAAHGYRRGWLDSVFTRRRWRRRGLAVALIGRTMMLLRDRGMTSAQLGVDTDNPHRALTLYETAGFGSRSSATFFRRDWD
jgi:ribosomal protein S18 acetylase RimI-like enzyme